MKMDGADHKHAPDVFRLAHDLDDTGRGEDLQGDDLAFAEILMHPEDDLVAPPHTE